MSRVYVTSDWHLGHRGISSRFRQQFPSDAAHDNYIWEMANGILKKRDVLICLGDMSFDLAGLAMIEGLICQRKILVRGNHDTLAQSEYNRVFDEIHGAYRYKGAFFTHIPIHESELYRGYNVHGHCHRGGPREHKLGKYPNNYYNAILEYNDYQLVPMDDILRTLRG